MFWIWAFSTSSANPGSRVPVVDSVDDDVVEVSSDLLIKFGFINERYRLDNFTV